MSIKRIIALTMLWGVGSLSSAQVSIDSCVTWTKKNYPLYKQTQQLQQLSDVNQRGISEAWLPKIGLQAQATYNTEVVSFNFPGMSVSFPHDAYMASLGLEQTILDGGQIKAQHRLEDLNTASEVQKNEMELYKLIDRVNQVYVNILLGRESLEILRLYKEDLTNRATNMKVAVDNQLTLQSALDELEAEILKTEQNRIETQANLKALYQSLGIYTGKTFDEKTFFSTTPLGGSTPNIQISRPELKLFELQTQLLDERYKLTNTYALPRISVGMNGNYGRPGPNFINQELRFFGSANLTVKWNVSSLYGLKREKEKLSFSKNMVDLQKETFLYNVQMSLTTQGQQMAAINDQIALDDQIISKRQNVTKTAVVQMENGKITVANYLTQLNAEMQAKLNKKVHEIKRMNAISTINATSGAIQF